MTIIPFRRYVIIKKVSMNSPIHSFECTIPFDGFIKVDLCNGSNIFEYMRRQVKFVIYPINKVTVSLFGNEFFKAIRYFLGQLQRQVKKAP